MKFTAQVNVMPLKALLDPQGKAVNNSLNKAGYAQINDLRIGKHISFSIEANDKSEAEKITEEVCKKLLANPIMEGFTFSVSEEKE